MKISNMLGGLTIVEFLRDYWQKKPLLIRQAFHSFQPILTREALFNLAADADVESRLITHFGKKWQLQHGPFDHVPPLSRKAWTLLIQGVNLHNFAADALLRQFNFVSYARLDDLMISYASDGGGVGPHFDSYDVFLLQAHGRRRWRIGAQKDLSLVDGMPLKILSNFSPQQEFILEPGDMLYLPPHYAHDGVALGECMTYSIGFRAPALQELGEAFLQFMSDSIELSGVYADRDLAPSIHPGEISKAMTEKLASKLGKIHVTNEDINIFLGEYLSEPKPSTIFKVPPMSMSFTQFKKQMSKHGVVLALKTKMLYRGKHVFINGESFVVEKSERSVLSRLADVRRLDFEAIATASLNVQQAFHAWYRDGWLHLDE